MISLGMIVRNAEESLGRCLTSVAPHVDEIVIGLGGESTDRTEEIARKYTDNVFPIEWNDDFAEARNLVLRRVTNPYFLWLDADDELIGGEHMRRIIEAHPEVDAFHWGYEYSRDETGATNCYLVRERLVKLSPGWQWVGQVHEVLVGPSDHIKLLIPNIVVKHHPNRKDDPLRNLQILYRQLEAAEPNPDPRILVYLGTENASRGNFSEALVHLKRYLKLSNWIDEKYQVQHRIADIYRAMGDLQKARSADFEAISLHPDWADAYLGLAETAFHQGNFQECIEWTETASAKTPPEPFLIINPRDYDFTPQVILGLAYTHLRDFEMAAENFKKALSIIPDEKVLHNLKLVQGELAGHRLVDAFTMVWEHLCQNDEWLKARLLFDSVPKLIEKVPPIQQNRAFTYRVTEHVENPKVLVEDYQNNPNWTPMPDEVLTSESWKRHPRVNFALRTVSSLGAQRVIDLGCSDGFVSIPVASENPNTKVVGIDLDPRCIDLANQRAKDWGLSNLKFKEGDVQRYKSNQKADLALLFEVIEHVVDPDETLSKVEQLADHVAITTPYLAWESPAPNWKREEFKGHLRIFDLQDIEILLGTRGRIYNLYRHKFSEDSSWIFADYRAGEKTRGHVTILAAGAPEAWSPLTFEQEGLGGSETAVIKLSEAIARTGYQVSVFSRISDEGYYNRVRYRDQSGYVPEIRSDLFIAWRAPELIDDSPNASRSILWMHDTDVGDRLTPARAAKFESIVVLTEWHKNYMLQRYPFLEAEKLVVIPNGVDINRFVGEVERNPRKIIYSSSPDRGLDYILEHLWPKILSQEPNAELHIYYGWNNFDRFTGMFPHLIEYKNRIFDLLGRSRNVIQHGRVDQNTLAKEMMSAGIWLYPTNFPETYCITAVEAQLAGLMPVTNDLAALKETVRSGVVLSLDEWPLDDELTKKAYVQATIGAMRDPISRDAIIQSAPVWTWEQVADRWIEKWLESESDTPQLTLVS